MTLRPPPACPTRDGFVRFLRNTAGIPDTALPDPPSSAIGFIVIGESPIGLVDNVIDTSLWLAVEIVNRSLDHASPFIYTLAVYNLATSNVINFAQDAADAPTIAGSDPPAPYFKALRQRWNINGFVPGVIQSSSDVSTAESFVVQEAAKNFMLADLQYLKDPFGRAYLAFAQRYGPSIWGLS